MNSKSGTIQGNIHHYYYYYFAIQTKHKQNQLHPITYTPVYDTHTDIYIYIYTFILIKNEYVNRIEINTTQQQQQQQQQQQL